MADPVDSGRVAHAELLEQEHEARFERHAERLELEVTRRLNRVVYGLGGARALFAAAALRVQGFPPLIVDLEAVRDELWADEKDDGPMTKDEGHK